MQPADPTALSDAPALVRRRPLRRAVQLIAMMGGILYWGVGGLAVTLGGTVLHLILPKPVGRRLGRRLLHHLFRSFLWYLRATGLVRADLSSLESLAKRHDPLILAPNHASLWDAVFIVAKLPEVVCVMKKAILRNPFLGGGARLAGYIPNGSNAGMLRDAADAVRSDAHLLLFPEGTRTAPSARWITPLKGGCSIVACRTGVPVFPIAIRSNTRFLQKGWPLWRAPDFPISIEVRVCAPLLPEPGEKPQAFTRRLQTVLEQELAKPHPLRRQIV